MNSDNKLIFEAHKRANSYIDQVQRAYTDDKNTVLRAPGKGYYAGKGWKFSPELAKAIRFTRAEATNMQASYFLKGWGTSDILTVGPDGQLASSTTSLNHPTNE